MCVREPTADILSRYQGYTMPRLSRSLFVLLAMILLTGCHPTKSRGLFDQMLSSGPLKVGIATDAPPLAYTKDGKLSGLEVQFAAGLAESLERKLEVVELPRADLSDALLDGKIDIAMAGMTVAEAHAHKLATSNSYLISGQIALVHLDDFKLLGTGPANLTGTNVRIGVVGDSSGDNLMRSLKPKGTINRFPSAPEAVQALIANSIDVFIFDLPANSYYASLYVDKGLTPGVIPLIREPLVWAVRPDDDDMRKSANAYLAGIEKSGELQKMLERAIPFYRNTAYSPKQ
jgi:polar amino acid transport system substrate-binding protein